MRPNFDRVAEVMWNQLKQTIPKMVQGAKMSAPELFGDTMPVGSMSPYRKTLLDAGIVGAEPVTKKLVVRDPEKALGMIVSPMAVANVLWPAEAEEWRDHQAHLEEVRKQKEVPPVLPKAMESLMKLESLMQPIPERSVIKSKSFPDDLSSARAALRMGSASGGGPFVVARPAPVSVPVVTKPPEPRVPEVKAVEIKLQQPPPPPPKEKVEEASETTAADELVAIELAKMKLMHATAENMVYIRDRLDGLIKRPVTQPPAPPAETIIQKEVQVVNVPVLPKEIPVVLTVVNAEHIDTRFEAIEQQLNEVLTILRKLL